MSHDEHRQLALRFSAASGTYDRAARAQPLVVERVCEMLACADSADSILEIGCGTGMLTERLVERFPAARINALDVSGRMIARARRKLVGKGNIRWHVCDVWNMPSLPSHSLVVSCSALHWLNPLDTVFGKLAELIVEGGSLVFGLMVEGTLAELRAARLRAAPGKPPLGSLPSAAAVKTALREASLDILDQREERIVLNYSSAAELLQSLHDQGVTGGRVSSGAAPLCRSELRRLAADYDASFRNDGGVQATYRVAYFSAKKQRHAN